MAVAGVCFTHWATTLSRFSAPADPLVGSDPAAHSTDDLRDSYIASFVFGVTVPHRFVASYGHWFVEKLSAKIKSSVKEDKLVFLQSISKQANTANDSNDTKKCTTCCVS